MSLNEKKFEQPGTITEIKDEVYVILSSLNNIVNQVNDLDKFIRDFFGKLDNEIHSICFKLKTVQGNITLVTDVIAQKISNERLSMQMWKSSQNFPNSAIETQQAYSTSLPIKIFEGNNANTAIKGLRDHNSESKGMLQCQLVKDVISVDHIPSNKGKPQGKSAVNILSLQRECLPYNMERMSIPHSRVLHGIGKGEVVLSQPPPLTDYPLAPEAPPPPPPSDCLIQLTSPKVSSAPRVVSLVCPQVTSSLETSKYSTCQPIKYFSQSLKSTKSSPVSPCELLQKNEAPNTLGFLNAQLPRSSKLPYHFVSISASSCTKTQISSNLSQSPKCSVKYLTKLIETQLRSSMTNPPQSKLCFTSTKVTTPQSSSVTSSLSSHRALAMSQDAIVPPHAGIKQNLPSTLPKMSKARKALMEAIRNGVQLRKTREIIPRGEIEFHESAARIIRNRRKAMGYISGISDSDTEGV